MGKTTLDDTLVDALIPYSPPRLLASGAVVAMDTHVRFSLEDYPIDQLAGAIEARFQEQGGELPPSY